MDCKNSNSQTLALLNSIMCGVVVFKLYDEKGNFKVELINKEGCKILGADKDKLNRSNSTLIDFVLPEHRIAISKILHYAFIDKSSSKFEIQCKNLNNESIYLVGSSTVTKEAYDKKGNFLLVQASFMDIKNQKEREILLQELSDKDPLSGLYNRRAYDKAINTFNRSICKDVTVAIIDLNGLKAANDKLGHAAGDKLIKEASKVIDKVFSPYGNVYKIGGDEFAALLDKGVPNEETLRNLLESEISAHNQDHSHKLALAVGFANHKEFSDNSILGLIKHADERMYEDKQNYYSKQGVNRRICQKAYEVLCSSYLKILRLNLTQNSYKSIATKLSNNEQKFLNTGKITDAMNNLIESDLIYPDDLPGLKKIASLDYFKSHVHDNRNSIIFYYRRKVNGEYKRVMFEVVPSTEYQQDNKILYVYVKQIEN